MPTLLNPRSTLLLLPLILALPACSQSEEIIPNRFAGSIERTQIDPVPDPEYSAPGSAHPLDHPARVFSIRLNPTSYGTQLDDPTPSTSPTVNLTATLQSQIDTPQLITLVLTETAAAPPQTLLIPYSLGPHELRHITQIIPLHHTPATLTISLRPSVATALLPKDQLLATFTNIHPGIDSNFDTCFLSLSPSPLSLTTRRLTPLPNHQLGFEATLTNTSDQPVTLALGARLADMPCPPATAALPSASSPPETQTTFSPTIIVLAPQETRSALTTLELPPCRYTPVLLFTIATIPAGTTDLTTAATRSQTNPIFYGWWNLASLPKNSARALGLLSNNK